MLLSVAREARGVVPTQNWLHHDAIRVPAMRYAPQSRCARHGSCSFPNSSRFEGLTNEGPLTVHYLWGAMWDGVVQDFAELGDVQALSRLIVRLLIAILLGGLLGYDRERKGKEAGLRTHMLVGLGSALFVSVSQQVAGSSADLSRIVQGVIVGIGFLGSGAILKLQQDRQIRGLTTAAGVWLTAAVGMAAGLGRIGGAVAGTVLALIVFAALRPVELWIHGPGHERESQ
jgi:putative Mg2+ transporter-C (MgtC) family protein